ncbi:MAG: glycerol-3-phosphate 1-O-acyltransferase PlsY [Bacillota bacterium]
MTAESGKLFVVMALCYLAGSVPWGVLVARRYGVDVLCAGSCSTGATNVYRTVGGKAAFIVLVLDALKGFGAALIGGRLYGVSPDIGAVLGGLSAILGHCYSPFLGFKGGKGVATSAGVALYLFPELIAIGVIIYALVTGVTRYSSLGSLVGVGCVLVLVLFIEESILVKLFAVAAASLIVYRHVPNIRRLMSGQENRLGGAGKRS